MNDEKKYYRGESQNYLGTKCLPSIVRLFDNNVDIIRESEYYKQVIDRIQNENLIINKEIRLDTIGYLQHYGFSTRLLDITSSIDSALFFACNKNFGDDGFIYKLEDNQFTLKIEEPKETKENIKRKINVLNNVKNYLKVDDIISEIQYEEKNENVKVKTTLIKNIVVDYEKMFSNNECNPRYKAQKGSFIMFGLQINENKLCQKQFFSSENIFEKDPITIKAKDKIQNLLNLSKRGTHFCNMFPDDDKSLEIKKDFYYYRIKSEKTYVDKINKVKIEFNNNLKSEIFEDFNGFAFYDKELKDYIEYKTKKHKIEDSRIMDIFKNSTSLNEVIKHLQSI